MTLAGGFQFIPPPAVAQISPSSGTTLGGQPFTLTGADFLPNATVTFGTTPAVNVTVVDASTITGTTPARAAGVTSVTVTNPDGQSATLTGAFTFIAPPVLTAVQPASGPEAGGAQVSLFGMVFAPGATVTFGGTPAVSVTVTSATKIVAVTAPGTGVVDVTVTNPDGQSSTLAGAFTFIPAPQLDAISPTSGPTKGGTQVTLTGDKFLSGARVLFGTAQATGTQLVSATELKVVAPPNAAGVVDVTLINGDGQTVTLPNAFTYIPPPNLVAVSPSSAPTAGGTTVTFKGTDFQPGTTVAFDDIVIGEVTVVSSTELTAEAPAHEAGFVDVMVINPDGQVSRLYKSFRYVEAPTIEAITPSMGTARGGTEVRITGTGFAFGVQVLFGGVAATSVVYEGPTALRTWTPRHVGGTVDVTVVNPDGQSATLADAFTFDAAAPILTSVLPAAGPVEGGTTVTLRGENFAPGVTVTFGGVEAASELISASTLRAVTPPHAAGQVDVVVTNPDGKSATRLNGFTYEAPVEPEPQVDAGTPDAGTGGNPEPEPPAEGCGGCAQAGGSTTWAFALLGLGLVVARRRGRRVEG